MTSELQDITILGSTGSIGTQTLDVVRAHSDRFRVRILTAGRNWRLLADQAREFHPDLVVIADESAYPDLCDELKDTGTEVSAGTHAIIEGAELLDNDIVVGAMVGYSGLIPTLHAIEKGKTIALANKETLVAGGALVTESCRRTGARLLPVDSEHSAIFQCLQGEDHDAVRKIILTASGGPFRSTPVQQFPDITPEQALKHPNWDMGAKVTIDSASMMNKGFEMIEARWLFDVKPENIEVLVHPQSVIHSMVEYRDGSVKAQLGNPDMRMPIRYALGYPERLESMAPRLSLTDYGTLTFERPDIQKFPLLKLAYETIATGGNAPTVLNATNEVAVMAFLDKKIKFTDMHALAVETLSKIPNTPIATADDIADAHARATAAAVETVDKWTHF